MNRNKKMLGGLSSLLGENRQETAEPAEQAAETTQTNEVTEEAAPEEEDELIASVEDEELKAALHKKRMDKRGRPRKDAEARRKESEVYTRFCAMVRKDYIAKLHEICIRETLTIKEIIDTLVGEAIEVYEEKHGEVIPNERKGDASKVFKR